MSAGPVTLRDSSVVRATRGRWTRPRSTGTAPGCIPEAPEFTTQSEQMVWERLRGSDLLAANLRVADATKDHELDLVVGLEGRGVVVVEVKGGVVRHDGSTWQ